MMDGEMDQPLLVVDNQRIIVPVGLRQSIVDDLHSRTHHGPEQGQQEGGKIPEER